MMLSAGDPLLPIWPVIWLQGGGGAFRGYVDEDLEVVGHAVPRSGVELGGIAAGVGRVARQRHDGDRRQHRQRKALRCDEGAEGHLRHGRLLTVWHREPFRGAVVRQGRRYEGRVAVGFLITATSCL